MIGVGGKTHVKFGAFIGGTSYFHKFKFTSHGFQHRSFYAFFKVSCNIKHHFMYITNVICKLPYFTKPTTYMLGTRSPDSVNPVSTALMLNIETIIMIIQAYIVYVCIFPLKDYISVKPKYIFCSLIQYFSRPTLFKYFQ